MRSATIAGAGIAGLTAALCLARTGYQVDIFERATEILPVGAGLQLSANALRVIQRLGCLEELQALASEADTVTLRSGSSGRIIATVPVRSQDGTPYLSVHRADLHRVLFSEVTANPQIRLHLGTGVTGVELRENHAALTLESDGRVSSHDTPLLVAADGIHSAIAESQGFASPIRSGFTASRMILPASAANHRLATVEAWVGSARHAVSYPIHSGTAINLVFISPDMPDADDSGHKTALLQQFSHWNSELAQLMQIADYVGQWPLSTAPVQRPYHINGVVAFVGDAAHAMLPFAAQGAAMAIEDAAVLAHCLHTYGKDALAQYEAQRRPRITKVLKRVRFHDVMYHMPKPLSYGRDLALRLTPKEKLRSTLGWLYDWQPPEF
ncbi:FAD-dependent monooxygenase [Aureimonas fodinaquatilis]|uniref:FAD-dependent monooxygenase n=1 Tax=Aureimonas fodinaquatilis TaxID=2565783 RepID=UPI00165DBE9B|nr:FAD-dependent monooxygenase [Aureimonas fodinaquatilis]